MKLAGRLELLDAYQPGEFGKTFRARDLESGEIVAVLILDPNLLPTSEAYTRLENEVTAVQAVKHPAVIRVYSLERAHHLSFVTREWIEGQSLLDAMRKRGTLPVAGALEILTSLAGGLEAVQKTGVPCPVLSAHWITLVKDLETGATLPKFNALNFAAVAPASPDATLVAAPAPARAVQGGEEYILTLASLAYRMLGGMASSGSPSDPFIPIPGLSEDANLVLRRAMRPGAGFASPVAFVAALEDAIGDASAIQAKPPRLPTVVPSAPVRRSPLPIAIAATLVILLAALVGAILLVLPRLQNALQAGRHETNPTPAPTPIAVATPTPPPTPEPTPTPDPRKVALDEAIKRVGGMAMDERYLEALNLLNELRPVYPEETPRLDEETNKIAAKLGSETNDSLSAVQLAQLGDLLETAAQRGSLASQMLLGKSYLTVDPDKAFKYFLLAADKNSEAMYQLGNMYASGRGTNQSDQEAFKWYQDAAKLLEPEAMFKLGQAYFFGKGVTRNVPLAFQILKLAADGYDNRYAQNLLGDIYRKGMVGKPNYSEAFRLWNRAAAQGWLDSQGEPRRDVYRGRGHRWETRGQHSRPGARRPREGFSTFQGRRSAGQRRVHV